MSRIRTIKPTFFRSLPISNLPLSTRLTFIGLWTYADDQGRGVDDPRLIKAEIWPLDDGHTARKVRADLDKLESARLIERYQVEGRSYLRIRGFREHQVISKAQPSKFPESPEEQSDPDPPPAPFHSGNAHGTSSERSVPEGKGREGNKERIGGGRNAPGMERPPPRKNAAGPDQTAAAALALIERNGKPPCRTCDGNGWLEKAGAAVRCSECG